MKAVLNKRYGSPDVLQLEDIAKPTPKENEVLVKIYATSINAADWHILTADIFLVRLSMGLFKPKMNILGADIAGQVEAVGESVRQFKVGDAVFGNLFAYNLGGFAEYVCAPESAFMLKPVNLSFDEAAAAPLAAVTAIQGLRDQGQIAPGQKVLINGASGGVGTFAVQVAKTFGAEVTAVCSTRNLEMARRLGADHVIDYTQEDFTQNGLRYDIILAVNGYHPIADYQRALTPTGRYVMVGGTIKQMMESLLQGAMMSKKNGQRFGALTLVPNPKDMPLVKELLETRKMISVIDSRYPLNQVPDAFRHFGKGHAQGKIIITVA